jgi:hypothetical protein
MPFPVATLLRFFEGSAAVLLLASFPIVEQSASGGSSGTPGSAKIPGLLVRIPG